MHKYHQETSVLTIAVADDKPAHGDALVEEKKAKDEKVAHHEENVRYAESLTEHGFGGQTTSGQKSQESDNKPPYESDPKDEKSGELKERRKQGYGEGEEIGA